MNPYKPTGAHFSGSIHMWSSIPNFEKKKNCIFKNSFVNAIKEDCIYLISNPFSQKQGIRVRIRQSS